MCRRGGGDGWINGKGGKDENGTRIKVRFGSSRTDGSFVLTAQTDNDSNGGEGAFCWIDIEAGRELRQEWAGMRLIKST